ncbi:PA2169 family four-helix-bundle protein [Mucilaginibacter sp. RS28]|uniref:PA2169 family four-helix-bundle protein n=1 Tax=Mucilaginibacter straminoryzae TaxID=2932774 RepID=A0A9X2B8N6_9SPHI|nr:PA2169 family four-helix-bundle protein [Mucilaginibacter straminoryzae]MCJ8208890.1 PA2169 family four-helix-bundle protein [Mucilaginibacter straminoryzae]
METKQETTLEILNDLVKINNDRIEGFERATKNIGEGREDLKQIFTRFIGESHQNKLELGTEIQALGKDIDNTTSASGSLHRTWLQVKAAFTGHDTHNVLEECEFGEDAIKKAYKDALEEEEVPAYIKEILLQQQQKLNIAHDTIKQLRDQTE